MRGWAQTGHFRSSPSREEFMACKFLLAGLDGDLSQSLDLVWYIDTALGKIRQLCSQPCHSIDAGFSACSVHIISSPASSGRDISCPKRWTLPSAMQMRLVHPCAAATAATHPGACRADFGDTRPKRSMCLWVLSAPFLPVADAGSLAADSQRSWGPAALPGCSPHFSKCDCACLRASCLTPAKRRN